MNKLIITLPALAIVAASATLVTADNSDSEVVPMLYMNVPFGGHSSAQREPVYGAALGIVGASRSAAAQDKVVSLADTGRPRLLDMRFKQGGVESLKLNGVSLIQKIVTVNADGSTSEHTGMASLSESQWVLIGLGVGATLCISEVICDDDGPSQSPPVEDAVAADAIAR